VTGRHTLLFGALGAKLTGKKGEPMERLPRGRWAALVVLPLLLVLARPAWAVEQRIALVIGNGAYASARLSNPPNDARLMARTLESLGFTVETLIDTDQRAMRRAIVDFGDRLTAVGPGGVALFYYAGHGAQFRGRNFMIPVGAALERESDLQSDTVPVDLVMDQLRYAGSRLNFVILDACRNNPLALASESRSATRGFRRVEAPRGTLISYATQPGAVAEDGAGDNSPFTAALVSALSEPGLLAELVFKRTANAVAEATNERQVPWIEGVIRGEFYFTPPVEVPPQAPPPGAMNAENLFWQSVEKDGTGALYQAYLSRWPNGTYAVIARARLAALEGTAVAAVPPSAPETPSGSDPAPEPVTQPLSQSTVTTALRGPQVQLGAQPTEEVAERIWLRLSQAHPDLLGSLPHFLVFADLGVRGKFYRLRVGPLASRAAAVDLCQSLGQREVGCLVVSE